MKRIGRLSPELEGFLKKLKEKYKISEVDFAKLLFLINDTLEEFSNREHIFGEVGE